MYKVFKNGEIIEDIFIQEVGSPQININVLCYRVDIDKHVSGLYWYEPKLFINVMIKVSKVYKSMSVLENENLY